MLAMVQTPAGSGGTFSVARPGARNDSRGVGLSMAAGKRTGADGNRVARARPISRAGAGRPAFRRFARTSPRNSAQRRTGSSSQSFGGLAPRGGYFQLAGAANGGTVGVRFARFAKRTLAALRD